MVAVVLVAVGVVGGCNYSLCVSLCASLSCVSVCVCVPLSVSGVPQRWINLLDFFLNVTLWIL